MTTTTDASLSGIKDAAIQAVLDTLDTLHDVVDGKFGEGYTAKHPAMLAGCVQACAVFYLAERLSGDTALTDGVALVADLLATRLDTIDDAVDGLLERERGELIDGGTT